MLVISVGYGQKYIIKGTLPDSSFHGHTILLVKSHLIFEKKTIIDSAKIKNNKFTFKGKSKEPPFLSYLIFSNQTRIPDDFIIEPGRINIMINSQGLNASGTPLNDEYNEEITIPFQKSRLPDSIREKRRKALREGTWTQDEEIDYIHKLPYKEIQIAREKEWKYIESHTQYPEIIFLDLSRYYKNHPSQIEKILPKLSDSIIKRIQLNLEREKEATAEYIKKYGMPESKIIEKIPESI